MNPDELETLALRCEALTAKATAENLADGGRYFNECFSDLTRCRHGEIGEYQHPADGELIELLWNNRETILIALRALAKDASHDR